MLFQSYRLRTKILILLTTIPLITLGFYLLLAVSVFEKDKIAYVYETSSGIAKGLATQVNFAFTSVVQTAKPALQDYISNGSFGEISQKILDSENELEWITVFESTINSKVFSIKSSVEKESGKSSQDLSALGDVTNSFKDLQISKRLIRAPFKDDRFLIFEKVINPDQTKEFVFLMMAKLTELQMTFKQPGSAESYLVTDRALNLLGPAGSQGSYLTLKFDTDFLEKAKQEKVNFGTALVNSDQGKEFLASFSRTNSADLYVASFVDKKEALRAVTMLVRKSVIFFLMLICTTTVIALLASGRLTSAISNLVQATQRIAEGKFDIKIAVKSQDEVGKLAASFNVMAAEVARLMKETAEKVRMESELKTAQTVQETLFPDNQKEYQDFRIVGHYEPASECGGDWWHYCRVDQKVYLWIGDATGHGAPAALITSAAKSAASIIERLNIEPAHALRLMNRAIFDVSKGKLMMTFFLACYDFETQMLTYANASHEAPFLIKKKMEKMTKQDLVPLNESNNPRLGQSPESTFEQTVLRVESGDRILFYTDGIPDIPNTKHHPWGERNFLKSIIKNSQSGSPVAQTVNGIIKDYTDYRQSAELSDDITFFLCEIGFNEDNPFVIS
jgi:sigma-B regulation protein RsbU (phosphoserine phosphatase)